MERASPTAASVPGSDLNPKPPGSPVEGSDLLLKLGSNQKKTKADGNLPKRRGPKPDSKPALNRRQELNRQAQRTHRQRKELYTAALESEVKNLRDYATRLRRERDDAKQESIALRELLAQHGITPPATTALTSSRSEPGLTYGSATYGSSSSSLGHSPPRAQDLNQSSSRNVKSQSPNQGLDYDAIGTDFVLTLEGPCRDHLQMLCVKANNDETEFSGHVLMASCPPQDHLDLHPDVQYPHKIPDMHSSTLSMLLTASEQVSFQEYGVAMEEITPVKAWSLLLRDERFKSLLPEDFTALKKALLPKIRCYGFGAVLEEFEVLDGLQAVLAKPGKVDIAMPDLEPSMTTRVH